MSSVSPSSSASNEARSSNVVGFDVAACLEEIRKAMEGGFLSSQDGAMLMKQVFPAYQAYLRKSVPGSSETSRSSSSVNSGSSSSGFPSKGRYSTLSKLSTWRAPLKQPSGFCYLDAIKVDRREAVSAKLGASPSLFSLMALEMTDIDIVDSKFLSLVGKSQSAHLRRVSSGEGDFIAQMSSVAARNVPALGSPHTFWHYLRTQQGIPTQFVGSTPVGQGLDPLAFAAREEVRVLFSAVLPDKLEDMVRRFSAYGPVSGLDNVYLSERCQDMSLVRDTPSEWFEDDMIEMQLLEMSCAKVRYKSEIRNIPDIVSYVRGLAARKSLGCFPLADRVERYFALVGDISRSAALAAANNWLVVRKSRGTLVVDVCPRVGDSSVVRVAARKFEQCQLSGTVLHDGTRSGFSFCGGAPSEVSVDEGDKFSFVDL